MSKYLSRSDLERIAGMVVDRFYGAAQRVGPLPPRIDPVRLAQEAFGLEVSHLTLSTDGSVLGMACFQEVDLRLNGKDGTVREVHFSGRDIVIDDSLLEESQAGRYNFTAAHELAHHVLVMLFPDEYRDILNRRTRILYRHKSRTKDWVEWQADTMAAAILMPPATVCECMALFGMGGKLDLLSSVCRPREYVRFCDIAAYLGVSKKALAIRMKRLGLLGGIYLENPYEPLNVWRDEDECDC